MAPSGTRLTSMPSTELNFVSGAISVIASGLPVPRWSWCCNIREAASEPFDDGAALIMRADNSEGALRPGRAGRHIGDGIECCVGEAGGAVGQQQVPAGFEFQPPGAEGGGDQRHPMCS